MNLLATDTEQVVYEYLGDVTSLRKATSQAISYLDNYQKHMNRLSNEGGFGKNAKAAKSFQNVIKSSMKDVVALQGKMKNLTDVKLTPGTNVQKQIADSLGNLDRVNAKLKNSTSLTTKEVQSLTNQLKNARQSAQANAASVENLIAKEMKFQNALRTVESTSKKFRDSLDGIKNRVSGVFNPLVQKLNTLKNPFAQVVQSVQTFKAKASESFGRVSQLANAVTSAFRRVSSSEDAAAAAAMRSNKSHKTLEKTLETMHSDIEKETESIRDEDAVLEDKSDTLKTSSKEHKSLGNTILGMLNIFSKESKHLSRNSKLYSSLGRVVNQFKRTVESLLGVQMGNWLADAANKSIEYKENLNLFTVAMGDAYETSLDFVNQMQELYGMDPSNLMRYAGNFYQLADAIKMPAQASANLALGLTKATNDIASLFNVDVETVFENLSSGMQGMSRAVRKYGMDIRTVTLQATAASLGINAQVETMSEANRQGLRFITMMRQAANATGDFARTIEEPANQLRIFKEQMSQLGRAIGDLFIDYVGVAVQYINGFVMALRTAIQYMGALLGTRKDAESSIEIAEDAEDTITGIGDSADSTAKKLKNMLAPFDELNVLQDQSASDTGLEDLGALDPEIEKVIADMKWELEDIRMKANDVRDALLKFFGFKVDPEGILSWSSEEFEKNLLEKFPEWTQSIKATFENWSKIVEGFKKVFQAVGTVVQEIWDRFSKTLSKYVNDESIADFISNLSSKLEDLATFIENHADSIATFATGFALIAVAFTQLLSMGSVVRILTDLATILGGVSTAMLKAIGIITLVVGAVATLFATSSKFRDAFVQLFQGIISGIVSIAQAAIEVLTTFWSIISSLWSSDLKPMLEAVGGMVGAILNSITSVFNKAVYIITSIFGLISGMDESTYKPMLTAMYAAVAGVASMIEGLWTSTLGPILEYISSGIIRLWDSTLQPVLTQVIDISYAWMEVLTALWNGVLAPLLKWLTSSFGPTVKMIFSTVWDIIEIVFRDIGTIVQGLLTSLKGLLDFLVGVFTGDWNRTWKGLVNVLVGVGNAVIGVFELVANTVISVINAMISVIYSGVVGLVNLLTGAVEGLAKLIGYDLEFTITAAPPKIPSISIPKIPEVALASGAVVTGPTTALIGEGRYDEAVIPLGNSPQMNEFASSVADKVNSGEQIVLLREQNELLRQILEKTGVNLDGKMLSDSMSMYQRNRARGRGV